MYGSFREQGGHRPDTADNTLLTTVKIGLIPAQRGCSFPGEGRQAAKEDILWSLLMSARSAVRI